ncbi:hypothetical protein PCH_Pc20g06650 [Penicillium rubens Wisconsin 54-1255]|uniref:Uncharacterized protein n=1 Tax=Penicillium rubens (strain ATCC 28089 / DSM 1075 / NRRL 1951 / Wisconsin 54-1255) TaxID=500485 RepID=B6HH72_PENRW|nr:hypothetical protein PCH_Pc20g06650 [Penicillium rubens Wisconsin 54-1255]
MPLAVDVLLWCADMLKDVRRQLIGRPPVDYLGVSDTSVLPIYFHTWGFKKALQHTSHGNALRYLPTIATRQDCAFLQGTNYSLYHGSACWLVVAQNLLSEFSHDKGDPAPSRGQRKTLNGCDKSRSRRMANVVAAMYPRLHAKEITLENDTPLKVKCPGMRGKWIPGIVGYRR